MGHAHMALGRRASAAILGAVLLASAHSGFAGEDFSIPDTGQKRCYGFWGQRKPCAGTGQDGAYDINPLGYEENGDGTVTDINTRLEWQQRDDGRTYNWYKASGTFDPDSNPTSRDVCGELLLGGATDWRLPTPKELQSIVHYGKFDPSVDTDAFPASRSADYWTTTAHQSDASRAWYVNFYSGSMDHTAKVELRYVRCVRGEPVWSVEEFVDQGDGTVADLKTDLVWQQGEGHGAAWTAALSSCERLVLGGAADWRLPNIKELASIVDFSRSNPSLDTTYFPAAAATVYWSSTSSAASPAYIWEVSFTSGRLAACEKVEFCQAQVRCVRGGR